MDDHSYIGSILRDIFLFTSSFDSFDFNFVPRICNRVADELAHLGSLGVNTIEDPSEKILSL